MADLQNIIQDNRKERERLLALVAGLKEGDFSRHLPNGWTITVALVHLAFWDLRALTALRRWLAEGDKPGSIPSSIDARSVNDPLSILSEDIPFQTATKLAADAAEKADREVEKLTPAQVEEFLKVGQERFLHRALHRREHLDRIEKTLKNPSV
jgi:hypothetical protein